MLLIDMILTEYSIETNKISSKEVNDLRSSNNRKIEFQEQLQRKIDSLEKLANRKKVILSTTVKRFIKVCEKIMTIDFIESDNIYPLNQYYLENDLICKMRSMVITSGFAMNLNQTFYTYLVESNKNRGFLDDELQLIHKKSELNSHDEKIKIRNKKVTMDSFILRSERLSVLLAHLNLHFRNRIEIVSNMIDKNGFNRSNYTISEKQCLKKCLHLAEMITMIIETPLIDEEGVLTEKSLKAIQQGNEYLINLNAVNFDV